MAVKQVKNVCPGTLGFTKQLFSNIFSTPRALGPQRLSQRLWRHQLLPPGRSRGYFSRLAPEVVPNRTASVILRPLLDLQNLPEIWTLPDAYPLAVHRSPGKSQVLHWVRFRQQGLLITWASTAVLRGPKCFSAFPKCNARTPETFWTSSHPTTNFTSTSFHLEIVCTVCGCITTRMSTTNDVIANPHWSRHLNDSLESDPERPIGVEILRDPVESRF